MALEENPRKTGSVEKNDCRTSNLFNTFWEVQTLRPMDSQESPLSENSWDIIAPEPTLLIGGKYPRCFQIIFFLSREIKRSTEGREPSVKVWNWPGLRRCVCVCLWGKGTAIFRWANLQFEPGRGTTRDTQAGHVCWAVALPCRECHDKGQAWNLSQPVAKSRFLRSHWDLSWLPFVTL